MVLIFDVETTGLKEPRLVEAAWIQAGDRPGHRAVDSFWNRYNPGKAIECGAMATHHIMDEDVNTCPLATTFRLPGNVSYLVGHNVDFDYQVACACGPQPEPKRICTVALSRWLWPDADSHGLLALIYRLAPKVARDSRQWVHGAMTDCELCQMLLVSILARVPCETWEDLWRASERARIPTVMPYGKHKGIPITDVPRDYKEWLLRQPDVDPYLTQALKR